MLEVAVFAVRRLSAISDVFSHSVQGEDAHRPLGGGIFAGMTHTLRSPYLDPMHYMQVDLLRRWRASGREDRELYEALLASISGIAQGLQATG